MHVDGYMVHAHYNGEQLTLEGTTKASRVALRGSEHDQGPVVIQLGDIERVELKRATVLTNGKLTVVCKNGSTVQVHYRRKQQADWDMLHTALGIF